MITNLRLLLSYIVLKNDHYVHPPPSPFLQGVRGGGFKLKPNLQAWQDLNLSRGVAGKDEVTFFKEWGGEGAIFT